MQRLISDDCLCDSLNGDGSILRIVRAVFVHLNLSLSNTYALIENLRVGGRCCFEHAGLHVENLNLAWKMVPSNKRKLALVVVTFRDFA